MEPELNLKETLGTSSGSTYWPFHPHGLPKGLAIWHKLDRGFIDLQFPGWGDRVYELKVLTSSLLEEGMTVEKATGSAAIRLHVPILNNVRSPHEQIDSIRSGVFAAGRLLRWAREHKSALKAILEG